MRNMTLHPFHRVGNCFGLTLWAWHRRIELWLCLNGVPAHAHPGQHVEIVPLFGWATFVRVKPLTLHEALVQQSRCGGPVKRGLNQTVKISPLKWFQSFSIPSGWKHWFTLKHRPLIFLNITTGRSAADNFAT